MRDRPAICRRRRRQIVTPRVLRLVLHGRLGSAALVVFAGLAMTCDAPPTSPAPGRILWRADGEGWGIPTFDDSTVYFVGYHHDLIAVDKHTGARRWRAVTSDQGESTAGTTAVIAGNTVAMGDVEVYGFDRRTGARLWRFQPDPGYDAGMLALSTDGQTIYAGSPVGRAYAIDGATGAQRWTTVVVPTDSNAWISDPVFSGGLVYACISHHTNPTTGGVVALDAATGAIRWSRDFPPEAPNYRAGCYRHVVPSGDLVVGASDDGHLYAMDRLTGEIQWTAPQLSGLPPGTGGSPESDARPLAAIDSTVVVGSTTGYITALDSRSGREIWRATANWGSAVYPLAADAQRVYAMHDGGQLGAFDLTTGKFLWIAGVNEFEGEFYYTPPSMPTACMPAAFTACTRCESSSYPADVAYGFDRPTGARLWRVQPEPGYDARMLDHGARADGQQRPDFGPSSSLGQPAVGEEDRMADDFPMDRRDFLRTASVAGVGLAMARPLGAMTPFVGSPNDKVVVAVIGLNGRGTVHAQNFSRLPNTTLAYVCDVDSNVLARTQRDLAKRGYTPKAIGDFRHALDDKDVDAVSIATPDHWHTPMAILAMQAGKHVYVEKPCGHNPREGELLVAAQRKYGRVVQMGNQQRSAPRSIEVITAIHEGLIGRPYLARAWYDNTRGSIGHGKEAPVPPNLDYELWQGPAPRTPYRDNVIHYNWHWFRRWGTGEVCNNGTHEIDVARWALGVDRPTSVSSVGGRYHFDDDWKDFPDTQQVTYDFDGQKTIVWSGQSCNGVQTFGRGRGTQILGTNGSVVLDRDGYVLYDLKGKVVKEVRETPSSDGLHLVGDEAAASAHMENFANAIRTGEALRSPIVEGAASVLLCHLGNIAQYTRRTLRIDPQSGRIVDDAEAQGYWSREYDPRWAPAV